MSESQVAAIRGRGGRFWAHLGVATILSFAVPYLGLAYLGIRSPDEKVEWQRRAAPLGIVLLIVCILPFALNFELAAMLFLASSWTLLSALSIVSLWRAALRKDTYVAVAPGSLGSLISVLNIAMFTALITLRLDWPEVILFRATETTPTVTEGDLLYGLKYTPTPDGEEWRRRHQDGRIQRGQLVLAMIAGEERLVRVLAVPGDIFAIEDDALLLNGSRVSLRSLTEPWDRDRLNKLVGDLAGSGESAGDDALGQLAQKQAKVVRPKRFLVARDAAFLNPGFLNPGSGPVPVLEISDDEIVLVPWAKFWSIGDHPGTDSEIVQPTTVFFRN
jgi:hypothetical protein